MGNQKGVRLDYKQESSDETMARAKAEYQFSERLYEIMLAYQNRYHSKEKPLRESERVGELSLELSRLYNKIWSATLELNSNARSKKKQPKQMEVTT